MSRSPKIMLAQARDIPDTPYSIQDDGCWGDNGKCLCGTPTRSRITRNEI
jgi:hypothetical protein